MKTTITAPALFFKRWPYALGAILTLGLIATGIVSIWSQPADASGSGNRTIVAVNPNTSLTPNAIGFTFNDTLSTPDGQILGTDQGDCAALPGGVFKCDTVFTFANGTIAATGIQGPGAGAGPVVGGTGAYEGCSGSVTGEPNAATPDPQDVKITIKLSRCFP